MIKWPINKKHAEVEETLWNEDAGKLLYVQSPFYVQESYRSARTNLMFLPSKEGNKSRLIVFTSSNAGEGKSTNCANLAIALAQNGKHVLLIDCDMRNPKINKLMHYHQTPGLSEYLAGIKNTVTIHENQNVEGLHIITSGSTPPNPTELLCAPTMKQLLTELSESYDYIMLDTPPINLVADALVLKEQVDGYILVVRANRTNRNDIDQAMVKFQQIEAHVFGFLLNDINPKSDRYGRYGKHGKYGKYDNYSGYGESGSDKKDNTNVELKTKGVRTDAG